MYQYHRGNSSVMKELSKQGIVTIYDHLIPQEHVDYTHSISTIYTTHTTSNCAIDANQYRVHQRYYPREIIVGEWQQLARTLSVTKLAFLWLKRIRKCFLLVYMILAAFIIASTVTKLFQLSSGACLEANYPVSYILAILMLCYCAEEVHYLYYFESYCDDLTRWQNITRWEYRNLEGALIAVFIESVACSPDILILILSLLFYLSGLSNFKEFNMLEWPRHASRALRARWFIKNDVRYSLVPIIKTSQSSMIKRWVGVLSCVVAPAFLLLKGFIMNPVVSGTDIAAAIYGVYVAGIFQLIFIIGIPALLHRYKDDKTLWHVFLWCEGVQAGVLCICKIVMVLCYMIPTRY